MSDAGKEILGKIREDCNSYTAFEVQQFLRKEIISEKELLDVVGGDAGVLEAIKGYYNPVLENNTNEMPAKIKDYCTEIYFWGLPSAGKTWALTGVLNVINSDGYLALYGNGKKRQCISSDYLNGLLNVFKNKREINYLPNKTSNDTIRYMNFKLLKNSEERKVAFIDLSGELVKSMANENTNKNRNDLKDEKALLERLLNNKNRKIHFFFIDYSRNSDEGGRQDVYFSNLCSVFNSKDYFKNTTDFIYIVITKADLIDHNENIRKNKAIKYFNDNYKSFKNHLIKICRDNEINFADRFDEADSSFFDEYILDFSMGEVLFLRMCRFDKKSSTKIVNILLEKVQKEKSGLWSIFD